MATLHRTAKRPILRWNDKYKYQILTTKNIMSWKYWQTLKTRSPPRWRSWRRPWPSHRPEKVLNQLGFGLRIYWRICKLSSQHTGLFTPKILVSNHILPWESDKFPDPRHHLWWSRLLDRGLQSTWGHLLQSCQISIRANNVENTGQMQTLSEGSKN